MGIIDKLTGGSGELKTVSSKQLSASEVEYKGVTKDGQTCKVTKRRDENGNSLFTEDGDPTCADLIKKRLEDNYKD